MELQPTEIDALTRSSLEAHWKLILRDSATGNESLRLPCIHSESFDRRLYLNTTSRYAAVLPLTRRYPSRPLISAQSRGRIMGRIFTISLGTGSCFVAGPQASALCRVSSRLACLVPSLHHRGLCAAQVVPV